MVIYSINRLYYIILNLSLPLFLWRTLSMFKFRKNPQIEGHFFSDLAISKWKFNSL